MAKSGRASRVDHETTTSASATRRALIDAAIESLRFDGYAGASARAIAARADVNPGLVFYHFGSVADLLVAALDDVGTRRMERYAAAVTSAGTPADLAGVAASVFREDLDHGYVTVLVEMIAGAASTPGLGEHVAAVLAPWRDFAQRALASLIPEPLLASLVPVDDAAHALVALYIGLEMLAHLDGDRSAALRLFDHATGAIAVLTGSTNQGGSNDEH
jgi:AcrR family transcriptional regulator